MSCGAGVQEQPCVSCEPKGCKEVWKDDLLYTGHSQVPDENSEMMGACCCEPEPDPEPEPEPSCDRCQGCPNTKFSFESGDLFPISRSFKDNYCRYKNKIKRKGGVCSVL